MGYAIIYEFGINLIFCLRFMKQLEKEARR